MHHTNRSGVLHNVIARCSAVGILLAAEVGTLAAQRPAPRVAPVDQAALQRLLVAEDARGTGPDSIAPLLDGLKSRDTLIRRVAVRAVGRLQRPDLGRLLFPALGDHMVAIRAEAANAIAQSLNRVRRRATDSGQADVRAAAQVLDSALTLQQTQDVVGALSEALGRLPFGDSTDARRAERAILRDAGAHPDLGVVGGLYWLALNRRTGAPLSKPALSLLRETAEPPSDPIIRRVAVLALGQMNALDSATTFAALRDTDAQVRRLALAGARSLSSEVRNRVILAESVDPSPIVRAAVIGVERSGAAKADCGLISAATADRVTYVALTAIDALGAPCADSAGASQTLVKLLLDRSVPVKSHVLYALSRVDGPAAAAPIKAFANAPAWQERMFAARAAGEVRDTALLLRLAADSNDNVREAAVTALMHVVKHDADSVYIAALASHGNQVVLAADTALAGSHHPRALPALLDALDRMTAEKSENAHDPRLATLKRIAELGSVADTGRLLPYVADFDTTMAAAAAALLTQWTAIKVAARPAPLPIHPEPLAAVFLAPNVRLRVTMAASSGGGVFTIRLFTDETPATAARIIRLAREHFYDGHVFQRVEPNFVVQGGGPDASEYMGDKAFMRDELGGHSHLRGTLGISARGRDTGDAQWFLNLVDNTRLDHEYTVFGEIVSGRDVAERILEGDLIGHVEVIGAPDVQ